MRKEHLKHTIHPFSSSMLDSSSSRTMDLEYLVMDPHLREDDLDLLAEFENCCHSNRYTDANIVTKMF